MNVVGWVFGTQDAILLDLIALIFGATEAHESRSSILCYFLPPIYKYSLQHFVLIYPQSIPTWHPQSFSHTLHLFQDGIHKVKRMKQSLANRHLTVSDPKTWIQPWRSTGALQEPPLNSLQFSKSVLDRAFVFFSKFQWMSIILIGGTRTWPTRPCTYAITQLQHIKLGIRKINLVEKAKCSYFILKH